MAEKLVGVHWHCHRHRRGPRRAHAFPPAEDRRQRGICLRAGPKLPSDFCAETLKLNVVTQSERLQICAKFVGETENDREMRLDSLRHAINLPCLIKVDVDGAEEHVLKGASLLNQLPDIRWLIETHSKELEAACLGILSDAGFQTRIIHNAWWRFAVPNFARFRITGGWRHGRAKELTYDKSSMPRRACRSPWRSKDSCRRGPRKTK